MNTAAHDGGDFDAVYVCLGLLRNNETAGLEIFELDDLELARARFAALAAGPPPTGRACWRAGRLARGDRPR